MRLLSGLFVNNPFCESFHCSWYITQGLASKVLRGNSWQSSQDWPFLDEIRMSTDFRPIFGKFVISCSLLKPSKPDPAWIANCSGKLPQKGWNTPTNTKSHFKSPPIYSRWNDVKTNIDEIYDTDGISISLRTPEYHVFLFLAAYMCPINGLDPEYQWGAFYGSLGGSATVDVH